MAKIVRVLLLLIAIERICFRWLVRVANNNDCVSAAIVCGDVFCHWFVVIRVAYGDHSEVVTIVDGGCTHLFVVFIVA